jgi:hypothetical protein
MKFGKYYTIDKKYENKYVNYYKHLEVKEIEKVDCLCIGFRNIFEGNIVCNGPDEGCSFTPKKTIRVALVVENERQKPFYVPIEDYPRSVYLDKEEQ